MSNNKTASNTDSNSKTQTIAAHNSFSLLQTTYGAIPQNGFIRQRELLEAIPVSASTLWRRVKAGKFPEPIKLSERVTCWRVEHVRQWMSEQGRQYN